MLQNSLHEKLGTDPKAYTRSNLTLVARDILARKNMLQAEIRSNWRQFLLLLISALLR